MCHVKKKKVVFHWNMSTKTWDFNVMSIKKHGNAFVHVQKMLVCECCVCTCVICAAELM